jgi:hypothetical protein
VITDTDHYAPGRGDALWAWKAFLRGHHPILMDYGLIGGVTPPDPAFEPARYAMGDTLRFATRMNLLAMEPRGDLSSTGYALASPGEEYLVLDHGVRAAPRTIRRRARSSGRSDRRRPAAASTDQSWLSQTSPSSLACSLSEYPRAHALSLLAQPQLWLDWHRARVRTRVAVEAR